MKANRAWAAALAGLILGASSPSAAQDPAGDWPQWRGPARDGVAQRFIPPGSWPASLRLVWSVPVGLGHSSPIVSGDRVFVHTREAEQEVLRALKLADGSQLWRQAWPVSYSMHMAAVQHGKGPKSTPTLAEGRLYTMGIDGSLSSFDAKEGRLIWRREFRSRFKATSPLYGTAASPLLDGGLLIAHVGGHHQGALTAFDPATGETRWSLEGDGPGYASAIAADLAGLRQVVTQSDSRLLGVAAATGRLLWSLPFKTPYDQNSITAVVAGGALIVSGLGACPSIGLGRAAGACEP